ncbi:MAG TPA: NAD(P)-dependent oxidoreductase [Ilumatobacter sp.]|nr:NAD(P)-dependent oxidoreductase [Ilumatobacter sp.]
MQQGARLVIAGATGNVALPATLALAEHYDVWAVARFSRPEARVRLEAGGVHCVVADLEAGDVAAVPADAEYVVNFAVAKSGDWGRDLDANAGGIGALMHRCRTARAVLHCSTTAVYQPAAGPRREDASLGDNHRVWPAMETYSISKIAAEAVARSCARQLVLPTTIARLNVPYGAFGGWPASHLQAMLDGHAIPVHASEPNIFNPIHLDDLIASIPKLLAVAAAPATVVNWGGSEPVSIEEWSRYLGELVGLEPRFAATDQTIQGVQIDTERMHQLIGPTSVHWTDGMRRLVEQLHPDRLATRT